MNDVDALSGWLDEEATAHRFSGVALAWVDAEEVFSHGAGLAHRGHQVPVVPGSRFALASVTKMVTSTTALRLVEGGLLSLAQPLMEILPPEQHIAALDSDHTLHHLLSHTSALPNYHDDDDQTWASFTSCWDRIPMYNIREPADLLPLFERLPQVGTVGEKFRYSDSNFIMVGLAIEAVTGRPFRDVATQMVLEPAGMMDSGFVDLDTDPPGLATGYLASDDPPETWPSNTYSVPASSMPDGGMIATAADMARFLTGLASGTLLSSESLKIMMTPHSAPGKDGVSYGYGLDLVMDGDRVVLFGHGGLDPGVETVVNHYPDLHLTVVILCNQDRGAIPAEARVGQAFGAPSHP